ncbi:MAG: transcriptional regulator GcvA [Pseudomonadota bacterium]
MAARARRLPSLNALRAFWAAARHGSLVQAAGELHVTAAAVSQQVRQLEDVLGVPLFERTKKGLVLTQGGSRILPGINDAFAQLHESLALLDSDQEEESLTLSVAPSFATKWLMPRLSRFFIRHPGIEINVKASADLADFERDRVDLAIRYGRGVYPGLATELLIRDSVFPVCSPELRARHDSGDSDLRVFLRAVTLLHDDSSDQHKAFPGWKMWLKAAGIEEVDWRKGPHFDHSSLAIEAAAAGLGVALASPSLVGPDIEAGKLVRLSSKTMGIDFAYFLVYPPMKASLPKVQALRDWLLDELRK